MKKWYLLLLGGFGLMYAQLRQYFVLKPTEQMEFVLKSIQRIEQEIQNLGKIFKETYKEFPDNLLYIPHFFTEDASWRDLEKALLEARLYLYKVESWGDEITDPYESYEHPAVSVYKYNIMKKNNEKKWLEEIRTLLDYIKDFQRKGIPERERPKGFYYQPLYRSSIYHPASFYRARTRWQTTRPTQPMQQIEQLD